MTALTAIRISSLFAAIALAAACCGCSCGAKNDGFKIKSVDSKEYSEEETDLRTRSKAAKSGATDSLYYAKTKGEKDPELEKLENEGRKALKNKYFLEAEKSFSQGNYAEAMKQYGYAENAGRNSYVDRRAKACKLAADRVSVKESKDIKKAVSYLVDGRAEDALAAAADAERSLGPGGEKENLYMAQEISNIKYRAYSKIGDETRAAQEIMKQEMLNDQITQNHVESWTMPIER